MRSATFGGPTMLVSVAAAVVVIAGLATADLPSTAAVDLYSVTYTSPSATSLGAMPTGNGRVSVNVWVETATGDLMLLMGLADALDENSNLLKLGVVRVQLDPPLVGATTTDFNQTLVLSSGDVHISAGGVAVRVWVDAETSTVRVTVSPGATAIGVRAVLDHAHRLDGNVVNAGTFGNGWGGSGGSFCYANGTVASFVGIYSDVLRPAPNAVAWYHRNNRARADFYTDAMAEQGLGGCGPTCWDPLTNRSWGAALVGDASFSAFNSTVLASPTSVQPVAIAIAVTSAQSATESAFADTTDKLVLSARAELTPSQSAKQRAAHEVWWQQFWNRSFVHVRTDDDSTTPTPPPPSPPQRSGFSRHDRYVGNQAALQRNASWPANGESPGRCTLPFKVDDPNNGCIAEASRMCGSVHGCVAFGLAESWHGGLYPQLYTAGFASAAPNGAWTFFVNDSAVPPSPPPPPPPPHLSSGLLISRQNVLMRFMDLCSSSRIGGGASGTDYFAIKYNGGILTAESAPKEDTRAWGPGQWWQNLRLPYYAMLAEGGSDLFVPMLRWYKALLPAALRRTPLWFNRTDSTGRNLRGVHGAWFIETMTQFGTFMPSEKGYHCPSIREPEWTVDWAGNEAINLHRVASIELLHLALDFYEHTGDTAEFTETILPLAIGVTDFVDSYYDRTAGGELRIWPTQSLEGYRPGAFPPTDDNTIHNDMPWVAGLHTVLPRLIAVAVENSVSAEQKSKWQDILSALPPLPVVVVPTYHNATVFTAAQEPYPPHAILGGSEQPEMYAIHPFRLSTAMVGGALQKIGVDSITMCGSSSCTPDYGIGWKQGVMNVALLGMADDAAAAVLARATTSSDAMRFPAYLPSMQDFRPNEDHLSNMRSALQYMILQHDTNGTIGLFPAWPCGNWSISFKLHAPRNTVLEGNYNHTTGSLQLAVTPISRRADVVVMRCAAAADIKPL